MTKEGRPSDFSDYFLLAIVTGSLFFLLCIYMTQSVEIGPIEVVGKPGEEIWLECPVSCFALQLKNISHPIRIIKWEKNRHLIAFPGFVDFINFTYRCASRYDVIVSFNMTSKSKSVVDIDGNNIVSYILFALVIGFFGFFMGIVE